MSPQTFSVTGLWNRFDHWMCRVLPSPIRYRWAKLWIRKDEFHPSLDLDGMYMWSLTPSKRSLYLRDLAYRRSVAHEKDSMMV